jgi:sigma-B regulation protein RsbU (phosphoserine phosphatase)
MDMSLRLVNGEVGLILLEKNGKLVEKASWGVSGEFIKTLMYDNGKDIATQCFESQQPLILSDLKVVADNGTKVNSLIASPIKKSDRCFGIQIIINKADGTNLTKLDQDNLGVLLNFVAVAVDNSILMADKLKQQKIAQEMEIARLVQETLLPDELTDIPGAEVGAIYFPAREVGGDFYDVIPVGPQQFLVILGDVSNKGVPAALVMSALSGILTSNVMCNPDISVSHLVERLNQTLVDKVIKDREMFVTLFVARFDLQAHQLTYCNAGHPPALFWDAQARQVVNLGTGGPILGQFADFEYKEEYRSLGSQDRLFLFTDGLTEAMDTERNIFGSERVEQVFTSEIDLPPKQFCLRVKEWVDRYAAGAPEDTFDDFTLLQVKVD